MYREDYASRSKNAAGSPFSAVPAKLPPVARDRPHATGTAYGDDPSMSTINMSADGTTAQSIDDMLFQMVSNVEDASHVPRPETPLALQSLSASRGSIHGSADGQSPVPSAHVLRRMPMSPAAAALPHNSLCVEGASRIRGEIQLIEKELSLLTELEERERQLQRQRDHEKLKQKQLQEQEEARQHAKAELEMRQFKEEARMQRRQRETEELKKRQKDKEDAEAAQQKENWERLGTPGAKKHRPLKQLIKGANDTEDFWKTKSGLRDDLKQMYSELDELQEADWVRKQKIKQSKAAAERLQAEAEDEVHLEREFSNMKKGEVRKEINKLQDELAGLERQDRLAEQRRKAKEDDLRAKRENESEKQVAYMEACRARAKAQKDRENAELAAAEEAKEKELMLQKEKGRLDYIARHTRSPPSFGPDHHVHKYATSIQARPGALVQSALLSDSAISAQPGDAGTPNSRGESQRGWLTDADLQSLEKEDVALQKARQKRDLDVLKAEHAALLQEHEDANYASINKELTLQLQGEARQNMKIAPKASFGDMYATADLPPVYHYVPQSLKSASPPASSGPMLKSSLPQGPFRNNNDKFAQMQLQQQEALAEIDEDYAAQVGQTNAMFEKAQADQQKRDELFKKQEKRRYADFQEKEQNAHNTEVAEQKMEVSKLRARLMKLEEEDANVAERLRQEERARIAKLEVELARERGLRQLAEQQTKWEQQQPSPLEGDYARAVEKAKMLEMDRRIDQVRQERQTEQVRWSQPIETHPELASTTRASKQTPTMSEDDAAKQIQGLYKINASKKEVKFQLMDRAALRIQKLHRVFRAKQELMRRQQTVAAERIQGLLKIKAAKAEVESRRRSIVRSGLKAAPLRPADKVVARRTSDAEREHAATKLQGMKKMMNAKIEAQELRAAKRRQLVEEELANSAQVIQRAARRAEAKKIAKNKRLEKEELEYVKIQERLLQAEQAEGLEKKAVEARHTPQAAKSGASYSAGTSTLSSGDDYMQRPDSGGFDGIPITDITEREWDTWLDSPDKPSTQQSSEAATAPPPSQLPGDANHKIALLEEQIGKLQQNLVQEHKNVIDLQNKNKQVEDLKMEKERQQRQIENLNGLLISHAGIIKSLQRQVVDLSPRTEMQYRGFPSYQPVQGLEDRAACKIQAQWRGHQTRKSLAEMKATGKTRHDQELKNEAAFIIQGFFKCVMAKKEAQRRRDEKEAATREDILSGLHLDAKEVMPVLSTSSANTPSATRRSVRDQYWGVIEQEAATLIQAQWRGYMARKRVNALRKSKSLSVA